MSFSFYTILHNIIWRKIKWSELKSTLVGKKSNLGQNFINTMVRKNIKWSELKLKPIRIKIINGHNKNNNRWSEKIIDGQNK